jgi:hypothetical protein
LLLVQGRQWQKLQQPETIHRQRNGGGPFEPQAEVVQPGKPLAVILPHRGQELEVIGGGGQESGVDPFGFTVASEGRHDISHQLTVGALRQIQGGFGVLFRKTLQEPGHYGFQQRLFGGKMIDNPPPC